MNTDQSEAPPSDISECWEFVRTVVRLAEERRGIPVPRLMPFDESNTTALVFWLGFSMEIAADVGASVPDVVRRWVALYTTCPTEEARA